MARKAPTQTAKDILLAKSESLARLRDKEEAQRDQIEVMTKANARTQDEINRAEAFIGRIEKLLERPERLRAQLEELEPAYREYLEWKEANLIQILQHQTYLKVVADGRSVGQQEDVKPEGYDKYIQISHDYNQLTQDWMDAQEACNAKARAEFYSKKY